MSNYPLLLFPLFHFLIVGLKLAYSVRLRGGIASAVPCGIPPLNRNFTRFDYLVHFVFVPINEIIWNEIRRDRGLKYKLWESQNPKDVRQPSTRRRTRG